MDKENTNQNITPVFWDENDGKWHFTEKCLNPEFQITYVTNPHTFETPDEAMQAYLEASQKFSKMMDQMKMQEAKIPTFVEELKTWYHNVFLLTVSNSYSICMGYMLYHFLLPNLGKIGEKPLNKVTWMDIDKLIAMPVKLENDEIVLKETLIFEVPGFDEYSENLIKSSTIEARKIDFGKESIAETREIPYNNAV